MFVPPRDFFNVYLTKCNWIKKCWYKVSVNNILLRKEVIYIFLTKDAKQVGLFWKVIFELQNSLKLCSNISSIVLLCCRLLLNLISADPNSKNGHLLKLNNDLLYDKKETIILPFQLNLKFIHQILQKIKPIYQIKWGALYDRVHP
jgi:precorrin-6B methylase 1